jgi:predicted esterase
MWQSLGILSYITRVLIGFGFVFSLAACSSQSFTLDHDPTPYYRDQPTEYYLYLPTSYSAEKEWPVFVGIHGFGSDGTSCLDLWQEYADREGFILVCPSLGDENGGWYQDTGEKILLDVLKKVRQECRVQDRVFLAGFSAGAQFVQGFAFAYPDSVSGVAVLSAGNYYEPSSDAREVPFLVVIGDQDDPVGLRSANLFSDMLSKDGFSVELHILPGVKHEVTSQALELAIAFYRRIYQQ